MALARWGANPRAKDIFLQLSYVTELGAPDNVLPVPIGMNPFAWLRANPNLPNGFYRHTVEEWVSAVRAPFVPAPPNTHVRNPDPNAFGVGLHIDLGVPPQNPADEAHFGAYGMAGSRAIVGDFVVVVHEPVAGAIGVRINGVWRTNNAAGLTRAQLAVLIGELAVATGQPVWVKSVDTTTATVVIRSTVPGQHFTREIWLPSGAAEAVTIRRESTLSLINRYHEGSHLDPNRRGRFRLAVATALDSGGQALPNFPSYVIGVGAPGQTPGQVAHELGHALGLEHGGHYTWGSTTADCVPQYRSLMSYAGNEYRFADADGPLSFNPARAVEGAPFGAFNYSIFQGFPWHYWTPPWDVMVDFNRNGAFDYGAFRAPGLAAWGRSCRAFVQGHSDLAVLDNVGGPVALVRAGTRLYAFWTQGTAIRYRRASLGAVGNKSCTGPADPTQGSCLTWSSLTTLATSGAPLGGISAYVFDGQLFVATNAATGALVVRRYQVNTNGTLTLLSPTWTSPVLTPDERSLHGPELTEVFVDNQPVLALLYLAESGTYRQRFWSGGVWGEQSGMLSQSGSAAITGTEGPAAIAWPDADRGWPVSERKTFVVLTNAAKEIAIHQRLSSGRWHLRYAPPPGTITTRGKPFITFRAIRRADGSTYDTAYQEYPGQFLIGTVTEHKTSFVRFSATYDRFNPPGYGFAVQLVGDHLFNVWEAGQGTASSILYSDSTLDNVFGVLVSGDRLKFLPHADGSPDRDFTVHSDFRAFEDMVCHTLQWPGFWLGVGCGTINVMD